MDVWGFLTGVLLSISGRVCRTLGRPNRVAEGGGVWLRNDDNDPEFWNVIPTVLGAGAGVCGYFNGSFGKGGVEGR